MPHGHCFQWDPGILWTSIISDSLIAASYMAIPFTLIFQIMRKRKDLPFNWMFVCFGLFIVACGMTHVMSGCWTRRCLHFGITSRGTTAAAPTGRSGAALFPDHTNSLAFLLSKAGYVVVTAETIEQAESLLSNCDILVTDIGLPDGNGCDLMNRFRTNGGTHGIAISGFGQQEDIARSERAGFFRHLTKPIDIDVLKSALRALPQPNLS